jgi:hypothetical protein
LFQQHPDYAVITSFPGLADSTGARMLAEIGDDRSRFGRLSIDQSNAYRRFTVARSWA